MFQHKPESLLPPDFEIDPEQRPMFKVLQQAGTSWVEVGYVWTEGTGRTSSTEHWYLYTTVPTGTSAQAVYSWPGYTTSGLVGTTLRLEPTTPAAGQTPSTYASYLTRTYGVGVQYLKGQVSGG
jgi:hypothetical protein